MKSAGRFSGFVALFVSALALARGAEVTVLAAASLSDALKEAAPAFEKQTGHAVRFSFGASGTLARQIQEGAPADVFISADEARVDRLEKSGAVLAGTRRILFSNTLVVVTAKDGGVALASLDDLKGAEVRRIAVGDPATVPAGTYAKAHLEKLALWEPLSAKFVPVDSVRAALAAVEVGNAEVGFVYRTDALISKQVKIAFEIPAADGPKIVYPAVVLKDAKQAEAAKAFVAWLGEAEAQAVFARYGFLPVSR